jgi:hypothetical protein
MAKSSCRESAGNRVNLLCIGNLRTNIGQETDDSSSQPFTHLTHNTHTHIIELTAGYLQLYRWNRFLERCG